MRISDWSSDVCSSDLAATGGQAGHHLFDLLGGYLDIGPYPALDNALPGDLRTDLFDQRRRDHTAIAQHGEELALSHAVLLRDLLQRAGDQIGRASCRERVCQYV